MSSSIEIISYKELGFSDPELDREEWLLLPSLRDFIHKAAQDHEQEIVSYLEHAVFYGASGHIAGDVLDPLASVALFPGSRTDGCFLWPAELFYYVRTYHLRPPQAFIDRMASRNWLPPVEEEIDWKLFLREQGDPDRASANP